MDQLIEITNTTNGLLTGVICFLGVIAGILLMQVFFNRFRK